MTLRIGRLRQRLRDLVAWEARDRDMHDEMQFHLESLVRELTDAGMPEDEARLAAQRRFGRLLQLKERGHDVRGGGVIETLVRDVRHAARRLLRAPSFTAATVLTLALALGANAAIFTIVHRVVLNPLPYPDSGRLVELEHGAALLNVPGGIGMKIGLYFYYSERARTLDGLAIFTTGDATLTGEGEPERIRVTRATPSLASVLRVHPALGRWFTEAEGVAGAPPVAVISHGLWMRRYGGDARVIGRAVTIDGVPMDLVGVMPATYAFPDARVDVWVPERASRASGLGIWTHRGVARMRDGVTVADVRADINALIADLPQAFPDDPLLGATGSGIGVMSTVRTLKEVTVGSIAGTLWILLVAVAVVWLVATANLANLFLVRAESRQREIAVRRAVGADGGGIARLFMTESVLLSMAAAASGVLLAWAAVRVLLVTAPATLPRLHEVRVDGTVVAFTLLLGMMTAVILGVVPLVPRARLAGPLVDSSHRNAPSRGRHRAGQLLMGAQVALALVLVVASGLMVRSFWLLRGIDPGFDAASTVTFSIGLPPRDYGNREAALAAHQAILDRISELPGPTGVSASTCLPLSGACFGNSVVVEGREIREELATGTTSFRAVAGGYFETMDIRLRRGRTIERRDVERSEPIAVIDEAFADLIFPNEDPIGRRVSWGLPPAAPGEAPKHTWLTVVGIVASTPVFALGETLRLPQLYMPMSLTGQFDAPPWEYIGPRVATMSYIVRSPQMDTGLLATIRRAVDAVDPNLAMAGVSTLEERLDGASAGMAFTMVLLTIAAGGALLLGLIGIYGVVSYIVSQRTGEIGVRLALGAEPQAVIGMIVRQGSVTALVGVTVGLALALAGSRLIESLLYGVGSRDPVVFASTAAALLGIAQLACWLPARRAARVSPVEALRAE